jgi:hypothetical protein
MIPALPELPGPVPLPSALQSLERWQVTTSLVVIIPILTYIFTSLTAFIAIHSASGPRKPPMLPYWVPGIGSLMRALNPAKLASDITSRFGFDVPVRVRVGPVVGILVSNASHFETMLRGARDLTSGVGIILMLRNLFGLPADAAAFYAEDDSGLAATPIAGTTVAPGNRIGHLRHSAASKYLYGAHLRGMTDRFVERFSKQIEDEKDIGGDWVEYSDLVDWLQKFMFRAATGSLCGPHIFRLNPTFTDDFWTYMAHLPALTKGMPRMFYPAAFKARDKCLRAIEKWHQYAWENVDHSKDDDGVEYEEFFGARIMRVRYSYVKKMERMSDEARAAEDLAMIFA